jgi:hypothetical protein
MHIHLEYIEIPEEKITGYLLVAKEKNDKSAFLANCRIYNRGVE